MKKLMIALVALTLISGCTKNDTPSATPTPEVQDTIAPTEVPTPTPTATPVVDDNQGETDNAGAGKDTEVIDEPSFEAGAMEVSYLENVESSGTTLTFFKDNTFATNLNICSGMSELKGQYSLENDQVTLWFNESTGFDFLDGVQFKFTLGNDYSLTRNADSDMFSCAGSDPETYSVRQ